MIVDCLDGGENFKPPLPAPPPPAALLFFSLGSVLWCKHTVLYFGGQRALCTSTHCSLQRNEDGPRPRETRQVHNWTFNRHDMAPIWLSLPTLLHSKQRKPTCIIRSPVNCCAAAATVARAATVECATQVKMQQGGAHTHTLSVTRLVGEWGTA